MNAGVVLSRHGSFQEIKDKMGGDTSFMVELTVIEKYAERSDNVFVFSHDSKSFEKSFPDNCRHIRFYNPLIYSLFGWLFVLLYTLRYGIRLLYVESVPAMMGVIFVNRLTKAKVVLDYLYLWHQPVEGAVKKAFIRRFESFLINFADYFIAANSDIVKFVRGRGEILDVGANSLLLDKFRDPAPDKKISRLKGKKIIFVGRLKPIKDPLTVIRAFSILRKRFPKSHLIMCGDGELRNDCEAEADENVHFLGFAKNMPSLLKACDIFVLSSRFDASPRALVEAMGSGLPCIATRVGGVPDYLDETCGILIKPGDEKLLADKIIYLFSNPKIAGQLGRMARERIFKKYDLEKNLENVIDFVANGGSDGK